MAIVFKCKMCGGNLTLTEGSTIAECEYCGSVQTVPKADDEKKMTLFTRANRLRASCEFDKAFGLYEAIVAEFPEEAEAYWGLVLCKYGIEYVDDPATAKKIPTCHRSSFASIMEDSNFEQALENADAAARKVYREEAKVIEEIRKGIIAVSANEEPYDIFICYKETDDKGERTLDSVLAQNLYDELSRKNYRVFFARISLEDKLGQEYEPYIFAALNSAKIMLVVGTDYEYFNAVWVKNEWGRFLKLMAEDHTKHLIPCYKGIDAYDMPKEFVKLQAQDLGKVGATQDLLRGIEKLMQKEFDKETIVLQTGIAASTAPLLRRAFMALEDQEWSRADQFCEQVLNTDPECAEAYLGKLMADLQVRKQENLRDCEESFDNMNNYQKAMRFADEELRSSLAGYIDQINARNERARIDSIYRYAKSKMSSIGTEATYNEAARLFSSIKDYLDADALAQVCYSKAGVARRDAILNAGKSKMVGYRISNYEEALKLLMCIPEWKDANKMINLCKMRIEEIKAKEEADRIKQEQQAEIRRKKEERVNKTKEIIKKIVLIAFLVFIFYTPIHFSVIIPAIKYTQAIELMEMGNIVAAYEMFIELDGFGDSKEKADSIYGKYAIAKLSSAKVGGYVFFGKYEQDNDESNGEEPIKWRVLDIVDGKALVISRYALDTHCYNDNPNIDVTWENSSLRNWLNNDFLNTTFCAEELEIISKVTSLSDCFNDKIFLLSTYEATKYFLTDSARQCEATDYAFENGVWNDSNGNCCWWLLSHDEMSATAAYVDQYGSICELGSSVDWSHGAVRPAMWIKLP